MSQCRSFGSNYHGCSQSRKISVGVLVDYPNDVKAKNISKAAKQVSENVTPRVEILVEDCEGHTPLVEKPEKDLQDDASPWVSTRSFKAMLSSSVAVHNAKITQNVPVATRTLKKSKEASVDHPVKLFASKKFGLGSDKDKLDKFGEASCAMGDRNVCSAENVENLSPKSRFLPETDLEEDKNRRIEPGGSETLRMKLWEIIGNVPSLNKQCSIVQPTKAGSRDLNPNLERDERDSHNEKINLHSDTIESDSEKPQHIIRKPLTRSVTRKRKKVSTTKQHNNIETKKSTSHKKGQEKGIFSVRDERSRRPSETVDTSFLHLNPLSNKSEGLNFENREEKRQSYNKSRSIPSLWTSMLQGKKAENSNNSNGRTRDILGETEDDTKIRNSVAPPNNMTTEQPSDVGTQGIVETPKFKYQPEDTVDSLFKKKRDNTHNPKNFTFERKSPIESPGSSPFGLQLKDQDLSNAEKGINMSTRISEISLNFKSTGSKSDVQDGCREVKDYPPLKPTSVMEQDAEQSISESSTAATDSENSEDDFHIKGCRKLKPLSPEIDITRYFLQRLSGRMCIKKGVDVTGCSPKSESLEGNDESSKFQTCVEPDHEDGFASAVALLTVALDRLQTKMKSMIDKRSAEILMKAADGIYLHLHHAESQMKKNVGKLIDHSNLKRRCLDARFQEQHEQLVGIHKRFKTEVDQHLQGYEHLIEDLEELGTELEGNVKRHEASNKKFLSLAEETINAQLDDAERKISVTQELARKKLLQLKLVVAECVKYGAFS